MNDPTTDDVTARLVLRRTTDWAVDADLHLPAGTTTALVGPNGAGKSTVVDLLGGLLRLDAGTIRFGDRVVDDPSADVFVPPEHRRVGVVFQDGRLFDHLTVRDNVAFGPRSRGRDRASSRRAAAVLLDRVGIAGLADRRPSELSGGQAQRVALCRALAVEPALLLLDEPLSALDVAGRTAVRRTLATHLGDVAAPRLLVTHDPVDAFLLADRVVVLEDGTVRQVGTPEEVRQRPTSSWAAELVGTNLLRGVAADGVVHVDGHPVQVADQDVRGPVVLVVPPRAVVLSPDRTVGSPRNTWSATVSRVDPLGDRTRVSVDAPVPLTAEITPEAVADLGIAPGVVVWLAIKATEIEVAADAG